MLHMLDLLLWLSQEDEDQLPHPPPTKNGPSTFTSTSTPI
jgi:hypothetical protein